MIYPAWSSQLILVVAMCLGLWRWMYENGFNGVIGIAAFVFAIAAVIAIQWLRGSVFGNSMISAESLTYVTFEDEQLRATYAHRSIPFDSLFDWYEKGILTFNGDVYEVRVNVILLFGHDTLRCELVWLLRQTYQSFILIMIFFYEFHLLSKTCLS